MGLGSGIASYPAQRPGSTLPFGPADRLPLSGATSGCKGGIAGFRRIRIERNHDQYQSTAMGRSEPMIASSPCEPSSRIARTRWLCCRRPTAVGRLAPPPSASIRAAASAPGMQSAGVRGDRHQARQLFRKSGPFPPGWPLQASGPRITCPWPGAARRAGHARPPRRFERIQPGPHHHPRPEGAGRNGSLAVQERRRWGTRRTFQEDFRGRGPPKARPRRRVLETERFFTREWPRNDYFRAPFPAIIISCIRVPGPWSVSP